MERGKYLPAQLNVAGFPCVVNSRAVNHFPAPPINGPRGNETAGPPRPSLPAFGNGPFAPGPDLVKRVERELGPAQLLGLLIVAGYYAMLGGVMRAVRLDVDNVVEEGMLDGGGPATVADRSPAG
jgi:hypothetical protein